MCELKAEQIYVRAFRATNEHVQPLAAQNSFLPYVIKDLYSQSISHPTIVRERSNIISLYLGPSLFSEQFIVP